MKILFVLPILLTVGLCQNPEGLLGGIPAKIHMEIFGLTTPYMFPKSPSVSLTTRLHYPVQYDYRNNLPQNFTTSRIPLATDLFAPAIVKTSPATKGQIAAYKKALKKEAEEELKEQLKKQENMMRNRGYLVDIEPKAVSYVNVRLGGMQNVRYHYQS